MRQWLVADRSELIGLMLTNEGLYDLVEVAFEDFRQFIKSQVDTVISHPALWIVVGSNAFRAITATDLQSSILGLFTLPLGNFCVQQSRLQQ